MVVYVVQGRHGELSVHETREGAFDAWANSNGYSEPHLFFEDYSGEIESFENMWFLDDGGSVKMLAVQS